MQVWRVDEAEVGERVADGAPGEIGRGGVSCWPHSRVMAQQPRLRAQAALRLNNRAIRLHVSQIISAASSRNTSRPAMNQSG